MKNTKIAKILGWGLSAGLVVTSLAAVFAAPAVAGEMEWTLENTPSWDDMFIAPGTDILDYDIGGDGDTIYAILETYEDCNDIGSDTMTYALVKSDDGGVTWSDITADVDDASNLPDPGTDDEFFSKLVAVAVAPDDEDWVAVAGYCEDTNDVRVVASKDGGSNFSYAGDAEDTGYGTVFDVIFDLDVSIEINDIHNIALAGINENSDGCIYRIKAGTWLTGSWTDTSNTTDYEGWMTNDAVVACEFSPNFDLDDSIVCLCVEDEVPYMQSGIWESNGDWNDQGGFTDPVEIDVEGEALQAVAYLRSMGMSLPDDYDGSDPNMRAVFVYINAHNTVTFQVGGFLFRIDNGSVGMVIGPSGNPLLASIDVNGEADTGKVMIGEYFKIDNDGYGDDNDGNGDDDPAPMEACCCEGVRVWHTEELDFCCPSWEPACKDPSGPYMALVMYAPDGEKAYASTSGTMDDDFFAYYLHLAIGGVEGYPSLPCDGDISIPLYDPNDDFVGTPLDESAFSVSVDEEVGVSFNQIGLIDTDIDYLSDVAICPDCSVIYLSSIINEGSGTFDYEDGTVATSGYFPCEDEGNGDNEEGYCNCDSVWRSYDNGDTWERVFHGDWVDDGSGWRGNDELLLRLPCDTDEECCTLYLGVKKDQGWRLEPDLLHPRLRPVLERTPGYQG